MGGKRYSKEVIDALVFQRKQGRTILELTQLFQMPKTTIWHHIYGLKLDTDIADRLRSQKGGSHKRNIQAWVESEVCAKRLLTGKHSNFVRAIVMLYWAEGHKKDFIFTNTDSKMLLLYVNFLYSVLKIKHCDIKVLVRTSDPLVPKDVLIFWSQTLDLPLSCFTNNHDNAQNKTKTTYGICRVMVSKSSFYHKTMINLIQLLQKELLRSRSSMDRTPHS